MTLQPTANREDVKRRGGSLGHIEDHFYNRIPDWASTVTSGGGSIKLTQNFGAEVTPGTTAGDTASIQGNWQRSISQLDTFERMFVFRVMQTTTNDKIHVGGSPGINNDIGFYIDLTTEEVVLNTNRVSLNVLPDGSGDTDMPYFARLTRYGSDHPSGDGGEFYIVGPSGSQTVTSNVASVFNLYQGLVETESNGNGDSVVIETIADRAKFEV